MINTAAWMLGTSAGPDALAQAPQPSSVMLFIDDAALPEQGALYSEEAKNLRC